jgi:FMN phosphatase YigB (HAD superfamily)
VLLPLLANVITVDHAKTYKPSLKYYALVEQTLSLARPEVLFNLSNGFDIAAARRFGFTTVWVERAAPVPPKDSNVGPRSLQNYPRPRGETGAGGARPRFVACPTCRNS